MPIDYAEGTSWVTPVSGPANGDLIDEASVQAPFESVNSRLGYLKNQTDVVGVTRIRVCADLAALSALTGMGDKEVALVQGFGIYSFIAGSSASAVTPWIMTPTAGGGRWYHEVGAIVGAYLPTLDGFQRVVQAVPGQWVADGLAEAAVGATITTAATAFTTAASFAITVAVGDRVYIDGSCSHNTDGGVAESQVRLAIDDGTAGADVGSTRYAVAGATAVEEGALHWRRTIANAGSRTIKLQHKMSSAGNSSQILDYQLRAFVIRP